MAKAYRRLARLIAEFHPIEGMTPKMMNDNIIHWRDFKGQLDDNTYLREQHEYFGRMLNGYFHRRRCHEPGVPFNRRAPLVQMHMGWSKDDPFKHNDIVLGRVDDDITYYVVFEKADGRGKDRFFIGYQPALSYYTHLISAGTHSDGLLNTPYQWRTLEELRSAWAGGAKYGK